MAWQSEPTSCNAHMVRLSKKLLLHPPSNLDVAPPVCRQHSGNRIVHLGIGAFHRAHQAVYTSDAADGWFITGASMRSDNVFKQLDAQGCLYTVVEHDNIGRHYRLIQTIDEVIVGPRTPRKLIEAMASAECKIISLTVTEKVYCHRFDAHGNAELDRSHIDIKHDLNNLEAPRSAPGFIVAALLQRFENSKNGVSILSCDNLPANGQLTRRVILEFASAIDNDFCHWVSKAVSFPSSMVDRIVPATSEADRRELECALGYRDNAMVVCEPFSQWVIEDDFVAGRPAWEEAGATFVTDVHSFETMKLRLLNGSHSAMAYLGFLAGYEFISDVVGNPVFIQFIRQLMDDEITPTLQAPPEINLSDYKLELQKRFSNAALKHQTRQVAMDGSQKISQRLLQPIREQLESGGPIGGLCLALAAWILYTRGVDEKGVGYEVIDPMAETLSACHSHAAKHSENTAKGQAKALVEEFLKIEVIFPTALTGQTRFSDSVASALSQLLQWGAQDAVRNFVGAERSAPSK